MSESTKFSRRDFIKTAAVGVAGTIVTGNVLAQQLGVPFKGSVLGANDRVNMGFIGVGNRGTELLHIFMKQKECRITALCDVYKPFLDRDASAIDPRILDFCKKKIPRMNETFESNPARYSDYRKLLENKDIDAVCIGTPDHWHAIQTIDAMNAGKDVYVEKPLTATIREGRAMVDAQKNTGRVAQVGLHRRGNSIYQELGRTLIAEDKIGKITLGSAARVSNMYPDGIHNFAPESVPAGFDWDTWVGPRPYRGWKRNLAPYYFRWYTEFSSQMGNWGVHYLDVMRWMLGEVGPSAVTATGGKFVLSDDREIPDTMQVMFEFASGIILNFGVYEATSGSVMPSGEVELRGTKGIINVSERGYKIRPTKAGQDQKWAAEELIRPEEKSIRDVSMLEDGSDEGSTTGMIANFLECIKSRRQPFCPLEEGHRSTSFAHLANISLALGKRLEWDPAKEVFTNSPEANRMLHYEYRKPWKLNV